MSGAKEYPAEPVACEILRGEGFVFALCFRMQRGPPPVVLATIHLSRGDSTTLAVIQRIYAECSIYW